LKNGRGEKENPVVEIRHDFENLHLHLAAIQKNAA
jgi:hypothetical protein